MSQPQPLRVLIAEDNPADAELVLRELRKAGFEPKWERVDSEKEYLVRLDAGIDVILSDYDMPQFGGPRALELLRERGLGIPFIIISGTIGEDIAVEVMKQGAADYLMKDRLTRLGPAVRRAIEQARLRRERRKTEESLRQSEAEFRAMTEASPLGIFVADCDGLATYTNATLRRMMGIGFQEITGNGWAKTIHPQDRAEFFAKWQVAVANKQSFEGSARFIRPDGTVIRTSVKTAVMREDDRVLGYVGVVDDITERRRAEEALRESEARTLMLVQSSNIGLWDWNLITNEVFYSAEWKSQLGFADGEVPGRYEEWKNRLHPEDRELALTAVEDYVEGRRADYDVEFRLRHRDGSWRSILSRAKLTRDETGTPVRIMGCHIDITERKRTEARFRRLVDSNAQGVMFFRTNGEITDANDAYLRLTGYSRADLEAGRMNWIAMTAPEFADTCRSCVAEITARGVCAPFEKECIRKDGSHVPVLISAASFEDSPEEGVAFAVDLTERKRLEQQFLRSQRMESIGTLAGGIAHDLNNILCPIMMSVPILRMEIPAEERERIITTIEMSADRGAQIVKQVLTFGRGLEGEKRPLQIGKLIDEMVKIIHATFPKGIRVESTVAPDLWPILGDSTQMHQVLLNFCINARDAMPAGGKLRLCARNLVLDANYASMMPGIKPGPYVLLEAGDNGSGIPLEIVERIFDPFFTTKAVGLGTGLGLSTVLGIVKNHGGHIVVNSEPGRGTTFQVYLPASVDSAGALGASDPAEASPKGSEECVLVVDDEETVRGAARTVLTAHGYRTLQAADGAEALAIFAQNPAGIALVLTDLMMPLMDGMALIHALRKMKPAMPIIASTGLGEKTRLAELKTLNIHTILTKPYGAAALLQTVHGALHPPAVEPENIG
jgi:PAS domain S-box-containing protein